MTILAWLLLAACVLGPGVGLFLTRPKPTLCECGQFKLVKASTCFDCTQPDAEVVELADRRQDKHAA